MCLPQWRAVTMTTTNGVRDGRGTEPGRRRPRVSPTCRSRGIKMAPVTRFKGGLTALWLPTRPRLNSGNSLSTTRYAFGGTVSRGNSLRQRVGHARARALTAELSLARTRLTVSSVNTDRASVGPAWLIAPPVRRSARGPELKIEIRKQQQINREIQRDGGMTATSICVSPTPRRPRRCCCSWGRGTDASGGHSCCCSSARRCSARPPSAASFQVNQPNQTNPTKPVPHGLNTHQFLLYRWAALTW